MRGVGLFIHADWGFLGMRRVDCGGEGGWGGLGLIGGDLRRGF